MLLEESEPVLGDHKGFTLGSQSGWIDGHASVFNVGHTPPTASEEQHRQLEWDPKNSSLQEGQALHILCLVSAPQSIEDCAIF